MWPSHLIDYQSL